MNKYIICENKKLISDLLDVFKIQFKNLDKIKQRHRIISSESFFIMLFNLCSKQSSYSNVVCDAEIMHNKVISKTAFLKYRNKIDFSHIKNIYDNIYDFSIKYIFNSTCNIYAIDGSKLRLDLSLTNTGYSTNSNKFYSEGLLSCIYNCDQHIPYNLTLTPDRNERAAYIEQIKTLKKGSILISDRGYYSYALLKICNKYEIYPIFRVKKDASIEIINVFNTNIKDTEILDKEINISIKKRKTKLKVRVIKYIINKKPYVLITTLFNKDKYSSNNIKNMYNIRWKVEEGFKLMKSNITLNEIHSKKENLVKQEVYMNAIIHLISRITTYLSTKLYLNDDKKYKINTSNVIKTINKSLYKIATYTRNKLINYYFNLLYSISKIKDVIRNNRTYERCIIKPRSKYKHK